jgi:hypothetical protein
MYDSDVLVQVQELREQWLAYKPAKPSRAEVKADRKRNALLADAGHTPGPPAGPKHHEITRGWMLPYLLKLDVLTWRRWDYWYALASQPEGEHALPAEPIPQIEFMQEGATYADDGTISRLRHVRGQGRARKMWESSFEMVAPYWNGWGSATYITYLLDWILFGFGQQTEAPKEPYGAEGCSDRLYEHFDLWPLILWPYDHLGDLFAEMAVGRGAGFYPTPHNVVEMMTLMIMGTEPGSKDPRLLRVLDPAVGTGRAPLFASNYTLCLAGQDVNPVVVKACLVNAYLFAPWMARSIKWVWDLSAASDPPAAEEGQ